MSNITFFAIPALLLSLAGIAAAVLILTLVIKALLKYLRSSGPRQKRTVICKSLGEALKAHRTELGMTQEFVAEALGVSRQAVSKWENGSSDPSTSNLFALAKLYGISPEELLREVQAD